MQNELDREPGSRARRHTCLDVSKMVALYYRSFSVEKNSLKGPDGLFKFPSISGS